MQHGVVVVGGRADVVQGVDGGVEDARTGAATEATAAVAVERGVDGGMGGAALAPAVL